MTRKTIAKFKRYTLTTLVSLLLCSGAAAGSVIGTAMGAKLSLEDTLSAMQKEVEFCNTQQDDAFYTCIFTIKRLA